MTSRVSRSVVGEFTVVVGEFTVVVGEFAVVVGEFTVVVEEFTVVVGEFAEVVGELVEVVGVDVVTSVTNMVWLVWFVTVLRRKIVSNLLIFLHPSSSIMFHIPHHVKHGNVTTSSKRR